MSDHLLIICFFIKTKILSNSKKSLWAGVASLAFGGLALLPASAQPAAPADLFEKQVRPALQQLPVWESPVSNPVTADWLVATIDRPAGVYRQGEEAIILDNGLVQRTLRIWPGVATVDYRHRQTGENMLRSVRPEANVTIDGIDYAVGGLLGQKEHGYLMAEWLEEMNDDPQAFHLKGLQVRSLQERFSWNSKRYTSSRQWPPKGAELILQFGHTSPELASLTVEVHYAIYTGLPLIAKWITLENDGREAIRLNRFESEILAFPETENQVDSPEAWEPPNLYVESDYTFSGGTAEAANQTVHWLTDSLYTSQVNWLYQTPCLLVSRLPVGPELTIVPGGRFESFRTYELFLDGGDRERRSLSRRRMYRTLAPWATENPIFMHLTSTDPGVVKTAIDQCAEVGYEMVILSFGSGLNMEDLSDANIRKFKALADYAHSKGIELGGYSLFSSRSISPETDVIDRETGQPGGAKFGNAPCLCSKWGYDYLEKLETFFTRTGFDLLEHDGPYPGDFCASTEHLYHEGYADSQWKQWKKTADFYQWLRQEGIYLNAPDYYYMQGANKCAIGYREVNWSLPRAQQIILGRQNLYDGLWEKTPSMGWTFVPLVEYHGGGAAATLEPLADHLDAYEAHMAQNYGAGVQACYRGPRLYDTEATRKLVKTQIDQYKKYRNILNSDIIHLRRPDGRDWDGFLHVNPQLPVKGFAMLFNPTGTAIQREIELPLYYTGLTETAAISTGDGPGVAYPMNREYKVKIKVEIPARGYRWLVIR